MSEHLMIQDKNNSPEKTFKLVNLYHKILTSYDYLWGPSEPEVNRKCGSEVESEGSTSAGH